LVIAAIAGIGGVVAANFGVMLSIALAFVMGYLATRVAMLTISSTGGENIAVAAKGIGREHIIEFIDAVDSEKLAFMGLKPW